MPRYSTQDFSYVLPEEAIAQPPARRDASRMLVLDRERDTLVHRIIRDLPDFLQPGDCVVINDTKVFRARLRATIDQRSVELLLVRPDGDAWLALAKPVRRCRMGATVIVGTLTGVIRGRDGDGVLRLQFDRTHDEVIAHANVVGEVPTPPYIATSVRDLNDYQTVYARATGSVAAPTAGLHITHTVLESLRVRGVRIATVTLHVGLGTFQPIRTATLEDHRMHAEWVVIPEEAVRTIETTRRAGRRVVAIGTTTLRALEGVQIVQGALKAYAGWIDCFITPGYTFPVVNALFTNFHLPETTLLVLVSAFASPGEASLRGRDRILRAYDAALAKGYRFASFGDAMLLR